MSTPTRTVDETKVAEQIVGVVDADVVRVCSDDRESLRFAIRSAGLKLRSIVLSRAALRRLLEDPTAGVKIEYLQRDILRSAANRIEYVYPRKSATTQTTAPLPRAACAR